MIIDLNTNSQKMKVSGSVSFLLCLPVGLLYDGKKFDRNEYYFNAFALVFLLNSL